MFFLADGDLAVLTLGGVSRLRRFRGPPSFPRRVSHILWNPIEAEKDGHQHFMLKEIWEQPRAIADTPWAASARKRRIFRRRWISPRPNSPRPAGENHCLRYQLALWALGQIDDRVAGPRAVVWIAAASSATAIRSSTAPAIAIFQSGETTDPVRPARSKSPGSRTIAICNVIGSMITREADGTLFTNAGPEIGVASTKAFTCQLTALFMLAMHLGQSNRCPGWRRAPPAVWSRNCCAFPASSKACSPMTPSMNPVTRDVAPNLRDALFLGRGIHYPIALEGALKLKEISYIHAEGYPAGEMKRRRDALIDENLPVVVLATEMHSRDENRIIYEKTLGVHTGSEGSRRYRRQAIVTEGDDKVHKVADHVIEIPHSSELLTPILAIVPLQLLAYHIAVRRGCDVDQPRNLAKSVTVE